MATPAQAERAAVIAEMRRALGIPDGYFDARPTPPGGRYQGGGVRRPALRGVPLGVSDEERGLDAAGIDPGEEFIRWRGDYAPDEWNIGDPRAGVRYLRPGPDATWPAVQAALASAAPPVSRAADPAPPQAAPGADLYQAAPAFDFQTAGPGVAAPANPAQAIRARAGGGGGQAAPQQPGAGWKFQPSAPDPRVAERQAVLERLMGGVQYQRGGRGEAAMVQALEGPPQQQMTPEQERRQRREEVARALVRAFAVGMGGDHARNAVLADGAVKGDARRKQDMEAAGRKEQQETDIKRAEVIGAAEESDFARSRQQMLDALGMSKEMRELSKPQGTISVTTPDGQTIEVDADSPLVRDMYERAYPDPLERDKAMAQIGADNARASASNAQAEVDRWSMTEEGIASKIRGRAGGAAAAGGIKLAPYNPQQERTRALGELLEKRAKIQVRQRMMMAGDEGEPTKEQIEAEMMGMTPKPEEITAADNAALDGARAAQQLGGGVDEGEDELRPKY